MAAKFFKSAAEFRRWLERHHASSKGFDAGFRREPRNLGLGYREALEQALCFGWIDGVHQRIDSESYAVRFTPRRPRSVWSAANLRRARRLISRGLMRPAGMAAFVRRIRRRPSADSRALPLAELPRDLRAAMRRRRKAFKFFNAQPPGYRRTAIRWVMSGARPETRARRMARLLQVSARRRRLKLLSPFRD